LKYRPAKVRRCSTEQFDPPVIVVTGLPRTGTSMWMLDAGGLTFLTDGPGKAGAGNPLRPVLAGPTSA
jgi:hypothetical protein